MSCLAGVAQAQEGDPLPIPNTGDLQTLNGTIDALAGGQAQLQINFLKDVVIREFTFVPDDSEGNCQVRITIAGLLAKILKWQPPGGIVEQWQPPGGIDENEEEVEEEDEKLRGLAKFGIWQPPGGIVQKWEPPGDIVATPNDIITLDLTAGEDTDCKAEYLILGTAVNDN